jgi:3-deoxy-D-manno-octulosonic acid kinase
LTVPAGYDRLLLEHAIAVARSDLAAAIRRCLVNADGTHVTLHEYAARQPNSRVLRGRGTAYAITLPLSGMRVVVRHNEHGGLFAPLTRDRFVAPTRAPYELQTSRALSRLGVPTPEILAYVLYPPAALLQRADVCSREVPDSRDLADILSTGVDRAAAIAATAELVAVLSRAGARHHDLNAKNILVTAEKAYVLDVDRLTLGGSPGAALDANLERLTRSLCKWREQFGARISDDEITELHGRSRRAFQLGSQSSVS